MSPKLKSNLSRPHSKGLRLGRAQRLDNWFHLFFKAKIILITLDINKSFIILLSVHLTAEIAKLLSAKTLSKELQLELIINTINFESSGVKSTFRNLIFPSHIQ